MYLLDRFVKGLHWSNQAHFIGVTFLIFIAAWSNQGLLIFLLGGTKSLSQALVLGPPNLPKNGKIGGVWGPTKTPPQNIFWVVFIFLSFCLDSQLSRTSLLFILQ